MSAQFQQALPGMSAQIDSSAPQLSSTAQLSNPAQLEMVHDMLPTVGEFPDQGIADWPATQPPNQPPSQSASHPARQPAQQVKT